MCLFCKYFLWVQFIFTFLPQISPAIWIFVIIYVENTFRAMTGEMWGKDFNNNWKSRNTFKNNMNLFLIPTPRYKNFRYLVQNQTVYLKGSFPSSPTYLVKNKGPQPLSGCRHPPWLILTHLDKVWPIKMLTYLDPFWCFSFLILLSPSQLVTLT